MFKRRYAGPACGKVYDMAVKPIEMVVECAYVNELSMFCSVLAIRSWV